MSLYETDFYSWTQEQAALLKGGRLTELDIENLTEEIETMGRSQKRELKSRLRVLLMHLLKWQYQPEYQCRSWSATIMNQRQELWDVLTDNPSLKPKAPDFLKEVYPRAVYDAVNETGVYKENFPLQCPWELEQVVDEDFLP